MAIVLGYIVDDFSSSFEAEVDVEVRKGDSFRVQEPFEEKIVLDWVYVCNCGGVCNQGSSSRTSSRAYRNIVGLGPVDVVSHNEEVGREVHLYDDVQLILKPFLQLLHLLFCGVRISYLQSFV